MNRAKKVGLFLWAILSLMMGLSTFVIAKEGTCNGGAKHNESCSGKSGCPDACIGGSRDGLNCKGNNNCPGTCDAEGFNGAKNCTKNPDCIGKCYGGENNGKSCRNYAGCPNGECKGSFRRFI